MDHRLNVERLGSGITLGECSCGHWEMRVGPDALVMDDSEEQLLRRNHSEHAQD